VVLVLLGVLVVGTLRQWRRQNAPLKRMLVAGAFAGAVTILLDALVNFPLHLPASGMNLVLLAGVAHSVLFAKKPKAMSKSTARTVGAALAAFAIFVFIVSGRDWQADRHLNLGNRYLQSGHYQLARREYEQSLSMAFGPTEVLFRLGGVYYQLDDRQQAKAYFERSLDHYLTEESLWNLAVIYFQDEAYEQSLRYVGRLLAIDPQPELREKALQLKENLNGR